MSRLPIFFILILFCLPFKSIATEAESSAKINFKENTVLGTKIYEGSNRDVIGWLGLPYAEPPIDDLRWKAPRSSKKILKDYNANVLPNRCVQISNGYDDLIDGIEAGNIIGNEDCLYLNIYKPENIDENVKLPVMFWIHGGGNTWGYSASNLSTPKEFLNKHDVIIVTTNYRLGPLGWLALENFNSDSSYDLDRTYNFGTLDLVEALTWVNENIEAFGGDNKNITIFGESAGARNVMSLLVAPQSKGLFHKAIAQSGYLNGDTLEQAINDPRAGSLGFIKNQIIKNFPNLTSIELDNFINDTKKLEDFLRSLSSDEIISYYRVKEGASGLIDVSNVIADNIVIPTQGLYKAYEDGLIHDVPVIYGTNRDEHKLFMFDNPEFVKSKSFLYLEKIFKILDFRYVPKDELFYQVYSKYLSLSWKIGGADVPATLSNKHNKSKVYNYRFDWDEEPKFLGIDYGKYLGAAHGLEISFIFDNLNPDNLLSNILYSEDNLDTDQLLADEMGEYWVNFSYDGNPNNTPYLKEKNWNNWSLNKEQYIVFDSVNDQGITMNKNIDSGISMFQHLAAEQITMDQKCYIMKKIFKNTTLSDVEVLGYSKNFMNGKCL